MVIFVKNVENTKEIREIILLLFLLDIDSKMIFDSYRIDKLRMKILSDKKAQYLTFFGDDKYGSSIRL